MNKILVLALFSATLFSCTMPMSIDSFEKEVRKQSSGSTVLNSNFQKVILYKGYDQEYHHFYVKPGNGFPRSVKVKRDDLELHHIYPLTEKESAWLSYSEVK